MSHAKLRAPFAPNQIGKLPKGGITLDYVGHAEVTDRLLEVDPEWTWRPTPPWPGFENVEGLFIELTVLGVTRPGFGELSGGFSPGDKVKSAIGDAIRNAAMRFGVALDLWMKETPQQDTVIPSQRPNAREYNERQERRADGSGKGDPLKPASTKQVDVVRRMMAAVPHELRSRTLEIICGKWDFDALTNGDIQLFFDGGKELVSKAENEAAQEALSSLSARPVDDDPWAVEGM